MRRRERRWKRQKNMDVFIKEKIEETEQREREVARQNQRQYEEEVFILIQLLILLSIILFQSLTLYQSLILYNHLFF